MICNYRWQAPRFDAPRSVDVEHVCMLDALTVGGDWQHHEGPHRCSCGAEK